MVRKSQTGKGLQYVKTAALTAAFFDLGLCIALIGPTLPTLAQNLEVEESSLSFIFTARGCGYLLGSIVCTFLFKAINEQLVIAASLTLTALGNFGAPFMPSSILLAALLLIAGCSMGILDTGGNVLCLKLWGSESEPWIQTLHFFFAFGATLSPILARPFINEVELENFDNITEKTPTTDNSSGFTVSEGQEKNENYPFVAWAFFVASAATLVTSIVFYCLSCSKVAETESRQEDTSKQEGNKFRFQMLILLFLFYFLYVGTEATFGLFIYTFAIRCDQHYSKHTGTFLNSLFWGTFAAGRFCAIFFSKCFSPNTMLVMDLIGTAISTVVMAMFPLYSSSSDWLLWAAVALYGWSMASLFPSGISWAERYITVTGSAASVLVIGASLGEMALPFLLGYLIDIYFMSLMYFCVASTAISILNFLVLLRIAKARGKRLKSNNRATLSVDAGSDSCKDEEYSLFSTKESNATPVNNNTSNEEN